MRPQRSQIEWRVNFTQLARADGTAINGLEPDDLTRGEIEGRRQAVNAFNFLRTVPGFEKSYIVDLPPQLGIRETRRVVGGYMLSGEDVLGCASFDDSIGVNGWPMESHVAGDVIFKFPPIPQSRGFNELPYRMLTPEGIDNLLVAGRCASMTHDGQSAARVSGACFVDGRGRRVGCGAGARRQYHSARHRGRQTAGTIETTGRLSRAGSGGAGRAVEDLNICCADAHGTSPIGRGRIALAIRVRGYGLARDHTPSPHGRGGALPLRRWSAMLRSTKIEQEQTTEEIG